MFWMSRPLILPGGMLAYLLGLSMGYGEKGTVCWPGAIAGFAITVTANLSAHYADEFADVDTDTLARRTWFSGGSGVLPSGVVPAAWALRAAQVFVGLAVGLTAFALWAGWIHLISTAIVGMGLLLGWFYSMPPLAFERHGLGEPVNALVGGLLMPLMGYTAQTGALSGRSVLALLPVVLMVMVNLLGVHWADRRADLAVGKCSWSVLLGERVKLLPPGLAALAYLLVVGWNGQVYPVPVMFVLLLTLPVSLWAVFTFWRDGSPIPSAFAMAVFILAAAIGWALVGSGI